MTASASSVCGGTSISRPDLAARKPSARNPSAILARIGRELAHELHAPSGSVEGSDDDLRVAAVIPRRIGHFRIYATGSPDLARIPWIRSDVSVPPNVYFDVKLDWLITVISQEMTPVRQFGYVPDEAMQRERINLAYCSPNANKPLHIGHARNMVLGAAIGGLLELGGARVLRSCCVSDYGVHIFKAVAGYLRWGARSSPETTSQKADHFVGRYYAQAANDPAVDHGAASPKNLMRLWLNGDRDVRAITRRLTSWAEAGFDETLQQWRIAFDHRFHEVDEHTYIDSFLAEQTRSGHVQRDDEGRLVAPVGVDGNMIALTRSDDSPLYMSHMVAAILQRLDTFGLEVTTLMTLTAVEQVPAFRELAELLDFFGYASGVNLRHVAHGMVSVRGRSLSSREGTALTIDDAVEELATAISTHDHVACTPARARSVLAMYMLSTPLTKPIDYTVERCLTTGNRIYADVVAVFETPTASSVGTTTGQNRQHRLVDWMMKLSSYPVVLERTIRKPDPSILMNFIAVICRDLVLLRRNGDVPAPLLATVRSVVTHALDVLHLALDDAEHPISDRRESPAGET
jgi:arginyl-tRNA synthetase